MVCVSYLILNIFEVFLMLYVAREWLGVYCEPIHMIRGEWGITLVYAVDSMNVSVAQIKP